ncbi:hypothetical protein LINPERPRIM_LOCUS7072 [Linum perenne]
MAAHRIKGCNYHKIISDRETTQSQENKIRVVSFEPPQQIVTKSTGVHVEDMLRDNIGRAKKKLMTLSNKQNSMPAGGSDEFSDYIGHVKNNFNRNFSTIATIYMEY